jgi:hypothetical protein
VDLYEDAYRTTPHWRQGGEARSELVTGFLTHELSHLCGTTDKGVGTFTGVPYGRWFWRCLKANSKPPKPKGVQNQGRAPR